MRVRSLAVYVALMAVLGGCRRAAPPAPPETSEKAVPAAIEVTKDGGWLFTYVEPTGKFATTDKPEDIPALARRVVRAIDPLGKREAPGTGVLVVDVDLLLRAGKVTARALSREAFETAALAQLPPGESSALAARPSVPPGPQPATNPDAGAKPAAKPGGPPPVVTLYGTSWCGACRTARQYFTEKNIPFADRDVERDPGAAAELSAKAAKLGVPTDRVPVIDIRGRLLLGFDRARVEALLGEST